MANYNTLKTAIAAAIKQNGNNEITGALLQQSLLSMISSLGAGYQFAGVAIPETNPGTPDQNVFYIASRAGTYPNFGPATVAASEIAVFKYNGTWVKETAVYLQNFLFAENCPFVKELYLTQAGIDADIAHIHNVGSTYLSFSNSAGDTFNGRATKTENAGIIPIYPYYGGTTILGYVIVDWAAIPANPTDVNPIYDIAKNVDYSPAIKCNLLAGTLDGLVVNGGGYNPEKAIAQKFATQQFDKFNTELFGSEQYPLELENFGSQATNTSYIWFMIPNLRVTKINRIKFLAKTGTINFYKIKWDGTNPLTYELITSQTINTIQDHSVLTINVDVELAFDEYIGINGSLYFKSDTPDAAGKTRNYNISTGVIGRESNQYLFVNPYFEDTPERLVELDKYVKENNNSAVLYSAKLDAENPDIVGTQTIVSGALRVGSGLLYLNKFYSLGHRTFRAICKNFSSTTIAVFSTVLYNTLAEQSYGNLITLNFAAKTVGCKNGATVGCELLAAYTHPFIVEVTKKFQQNIVRIVDMYNGAEWTNTWTFNGTGGVGDGAIGTLVNTGMAWDMYSFRTTQGTFDIEQIMVLGEKADVVFYGDSITEPEAYWPNNMLELSWTQLLYYKSRHRIISSGRSGTGIATLLTRMQSELPGLKPKAVFITIGTNGGINYASMEALVNYIRSLNIIPYVNHIPANINTGGVSNHAAVNAIVDQIRAGMNVTGIDFDKPTSVDYAGGNVDTAKMWMEQYGGTDGTVYHHPNVLGSAAMVSRVLIDTPEIYSL